MSKKWKIWIPCHCLCQRNLSKICMLLSNLKRHISKPILISHHVMCSLISSCCCDHLNSILSFPLAFQINLCHIIWTSKNTPKVSSIITSFFRGLRMKMNPINQKNNVRMFITSILKCLKKNQILAKIFHLLSNTWTLFSNCRKF